MSRKPGAGEKNIRCYRTACQTTEGVTFYNSSTQKYYCRSCAVDINYWSFFDEGVILCKEDKLETDKL